MKLNLRGIISLSLFEMEKNEIFRDTGHLETVQPKLQRSIKSNLFFEGQI